MRSPAPTAVAALPQLRVPVPPRLLLVLPLVASVVVAGIGPGWAASLGGLDGRSLGGWQVPGDPGAPTVVTWDDFTGPDKEHLDGRSLAGPGVWQAQTKDWVIDANRAATGGTSTTMVTVDAGINDGVVHATLELGVTADAGLSALRSSTNGLEASYGRDSNGSISLVLRDTGVTELAAVKNVGLPASAVMSLDASTDTIRISFDGIEVLTYTLTAAESTALRTKSNTGYGLVAASDGVTRFDDFHVDR